MSKKLDQICSEKGYKKSGLVKVLIREFLEREEGAQTARKAPKQDLKKLVGIVSLGGDAVDDASNYFE